MAKYRKSHVPDFKNVSQAFAQTARREADTAIADFAATERNKFVRKIQRQDFPSFDATPLSPRWYRKKIRNRADLRIMIATGHYIRSIQVFTKKQSRYRMLFQVGFHHRTLARDLNNQIVPYPLYKIARVQEHGSTKMKVPARPHWRPHYESMRLQADPLRRRIRIRTMRILRSRFKGRIKTL